MSASGAFTAGIDLFLAFFRLKSIHRVAGT
jgi:hypothetical protein